MLKISDYFTIGQAARILGVTPNTIRNWMKENKITSYRNPLNNYHLFRRGDLEEILSNIKPI